MLGSQHHNYGAASADAAEHSELSVHDPQARTKRTFRIVAASALGLAVVCACGFAAIHRSDDRTIGRSTELIIKAPPPFSTVSPLELGVLGVHRPDASRPTATWGDLRNTNNETRPANLPTNAWWENVVLGDQDREGPFNTLVALPYTFDASGPEPGLRVHYPHTLTRGNLQVVTEYDWRRALQLGSMSAVGKHIVRDPGPLSITLEWSASAAGTDRKLMSAPIVRGAPYATMEYYGLEPNISCVQALAKDPLIDGVSVPCDGSAFKVGHEMELSFKSDDTWLVFISTPTMFVCRQGELDDLDGTGVTFTGIQPLDGVIRAALLNNCTTGHSFTDCEVPGQPRKHDKFRAVLRNHADVYPTGAADIGYHLPTEPQLFKVKEASAVINFVWGAKSMRGASAPGAATAVSAALAAGYSDASDIPEDADSDQSASSAGVEPINAAATAAAATAAAAGVVTNGLIPPPKLLMYSLPHHRETLDPTTARRIPDGIGAVRTLNGMAMLVSGDAWSLDIPLHDTSFRTPNKPKEEMLKAIHEALDEDIKFEMPLNYQRGVGDTYFSGKMLGKMARVALIADDLGRHDDAMMVVHRLKQYAEVWLNGSARAPLLYDLQWGGIISCGCNYDDQNDTIGPQCLNEIGPGCPGLSDVGQNFGAGFYNDHLFHYGYHIYAAAVVSKFLPHWGMQFYDRVMLLVRDFANPSPEDPWFPPFRHKDWYLGSSWALGIPTLGGSPYSNGRNEESSSEAVAAYDAVALYGEVMAQVFADHGNAALAQSCSHVRRTGRLLLSTEIKAAQSYWHVRPPNTPGVERIYPEGYSPFVVGMLWSTLAQMQTWFGGEAWKVYGIQMLPILPVSETLLSKDWLIDLLPNYEESCILDTNPAKQCISEGWSVPYHAAQAIVGNWTAAWKGVAALPDSVFNSAGGNGHSRTNSLWFIATRGD